MQSRNIDETKLWLGRRESSLEITSWPVTNDTVSYNALFTERVKALPLNRDSIIYYSFNRLCLVFIFV